MINAVAFPKNADLSGLALERNSSGYVLSPWWTFSLSDDEKEFGRYNWTSRFHAIVDASKQAFAAKVGIRVERVMVSQKKMDGELWWRLSSAYPVALPKPDKSVLPENSGAIDV